MSKESDFVESLQGFSESLENLVELLKEQNKDNPAEVFGKLVESFDSSISTIAQDIVNIKEDVQNINNNTDKILTAVKNQNEAKETGMMGEMESKSSKDKVTGAIKTVILIAAGVLAIGMAFKIVGDVDFKSVVALGMGIMFTAYAFAKVASITDDKGKAIDLKRAAGVAGIMLIMSGAIAVSGLILSYMPTLNFLTLLTVIGIGLGLGIATYLILKAVGQLSMKQIGMAALVPTLLPLISFGIVASSFILIETKMVSGAQILTAIGVSLAMGIVLFTVGKVAQSLKNAKISDILMVGVIMPIMAIGVVLSSIILQHTQPVDFKKALMAGLVIGAVTLAMVPTIYLLKKAGMLNPKAILDLLVGVVAIVLISAAIMLSSHILALGNYSKYPNFKWAAGVGLALLTFTIPIMVVGLMIAASFGLGLIALAAGIGGVLLMAGAIVAASHILAEGNYSSYPTIEWAGGVGGSIMAFASALAIQTGLSIISGFFGGGDVDLGAFIKKISRAIVEAGKIFSEAGDYWQAGNFPGIEWAGGVGGSIMAFAKALQIQEEINSGLFSSGDVDLGAFIKKISRAIIDAGTEFSGTEGLWNEGTYPSKEWAGGVGGSILAFAQAINALKEAGIDVDADDLKDNDGAVAVMLGLTRGIIEVGRVFSKESKPEYWNLDMIPGKDWVSNISNMLESLSNENSQDNFSKMVSSMQRLARIRFSNMSYIWYLSMSVRHLSKTLEEFNTEKIEKIMKLGAGFQLISLVDSDGLEDVLDTIEDKANILKRATDDGGYIRDMLDKAFNIGSDSTTSTTSDGTSGSASGGAVVNEFSPFETKLLSHISNIDTNVELLLPDTTETEEELNGPNVEGH